METPKSDLFSRLDSSQQLHAEILRYQLVAEREASSRCEAEKTLRESAREVLDFRKQIDELHWSLARSQFSALSAAQRKVHAITHVNPGNKRGFIDPEYVTKDKRHNEIPANANTPTAGTTTPHVATTVCTPSSESVLEVLGQRASEEGYTLALHVSCISKWEFFVDTLIGEVLKERSKSSEMSTRYQRMELEFANSCDTLAETVANHRAEMETLEKEIRTLTDKNVALCAELRLISKQLEHFDEGGLGPILNYSFKPKGEVNANVPTHPDSSGSNHERVPSVEDLQGLILVEGSEYRSGQLSESVTRVLSLCQSAFHQVRAEVVELQGEVCRLRETNAHQIAHSLELLEWASVEGAVCLRNAHAEFHHRVLLSVFEMYSRVAEDTYTNLAVQTSLENQYDKSSRVLALAKSAARRERQALIASHAVELAAASQSVASNQRRIEELSAKLSRALARESQSRRQLKIKEGELEVMRELGEQRGRDLHRKQLALDALRSEFEACRKNSAATTELLRAEREESLRCNRELVKLRKQLEVTKEELEGARSQARTMTERYREELDKTREDYTKESLLLQKIHAAECHSLRGELRQATAALAESAGKQTASSKALEVATEETKVLKNLINAYEEEMSGMREELKRAKITLQEGLKRWIVPHQREIGTQCGGCGDDMTVFEDRDFMLAITSKANAFESVTQELLRSEKRIDALEKENRELRAVCELSVNQSVVLLEELQRKRSGASSVNESFAVR